MDAAAPHAASTSDVADSLLGLRRAPLAHASEANPEPVAAPAAAQQTATPATSVRRPPTGADSTQKLESALRLAQRALLDDLRAHGERLLALNPSRREAIARRLGLLSGLVAPAGSPTPAPAPGASCRLRRIFEGPRAPATDSALDAYLREVATLWLGQCLLLRAWADRGLRAARPADFQLATSVLANHLRPYLPLDREGWQITRQNLYSWFQPSEDAARRVEESLSGWRYTDEGPEALVEILLRVHSSGENSGYPARFWGAIWRELPELGLDLSPGAGPIPRGRLAFSSTLRTGAVVRSGPTHLAWSGFESSPYLLLLAELAQLWWGPSSPPLWIPGMSLAAHPRDQLSLGLGSVRPNLLTRIAETEACDVAWVGEEKALRLNGRSAEAQEARAEVEALPFFRRLRGATTSVGALQACVALSKLRQGGLLFWARESPLGTADGPEVLRYLLDRGVLVAEWDLQTLTPPGNDALPPYLYLFRRETDLETRSAHHPRRIRAAGAVRNELEWNIAFPEALRWATRPESAFDAVPAPSDPPGAGWRIHASVSPAAQREWADRWPDPIERERQDRADALRARSDLLVNWVTVRPHTQASASEPRWTGIWISTADGRLDTRPRLGDESDPLPTGGAPAFRLICPHASWVWPLTAYLRSENLRAWLELEVERRGARWVLTEQKLKVLPLPRALVEALAGNGTAGTFAAPLPGDWERVSAELETAPERVRARLESTGAGALPSEVRLALFVRAARSLGERTRRLAPLLRMVGPRGELVWRELLQLLPPAETTGLGMHSQIRIQGNLPPSVPIARLERIRMPLPGILLLTEVGLQVKLLCDSPRLLDLLWSQMEGLQHHTWSEISAYVRLPRDPGNLEALAEDLLRAHGEETRQLQALEGVLRTCEGI